MPHSRSHPPLIARTLASVAAALVLLTAGVAAQAREMVAVDRDDIHLREGAGTRYRALWLLGRGYPLEVLGRKGSWLRVRDFENDEGWVYQPLTTARKPHHVVKSDVANIRGGPGLGHRVLGKAAQGETLETLERRGDWVKVRQDGGRVGWVARRLLWGW